MERSSMARSWWRAVPPGGSCAIASGGEPGLDSIKAVDPTYADLKHEITNTGGPDQKYTIAAGDNLSKVSKLFYGNPNHYAKIAEASGIANPDHIQVGQEVTVPVLS